MTETFKFLIYDVGISDVMHGESISAFGHATSFADDGYLGGCKLADFSGGYRIIVPSLSE
jgi:hypothetical protein